MNIPQRATWRKTWRAPNLGIVDEPMALSLLKYRAAEDRTVADPADANLISSHIVGTKLHAPIIDLDFPHRYQRSTQPGHAHLYLDGPISWPRTVILLWALKLAKVIEPGYFWWSIRRGATFVRAPGVLKSTAEEKVTYTHGMFRKLPQFRKKIR